MGQSRTTPDLLDNALERASELTDGTSSYETIALVYMNQIYQSIISGGSEFDIDIDEPWVWARRDPPIHLELQTKVTGTATFTNGDEVVTASVSISTDLIGWFIKVDSENTVYRIGKHGTGTGIEIESNYVGTTGSKSFTAFKLDYKLEAPYIIIKSSENDRIDFEETSGTELTATLTAGVYTPSELATEMKTQLDSAGGRTYTVSYATNTRLLTISHDGDGTTAGQLLNLKFGTGTNAATRNFAHTGGFDIEDLSGTNTYTAIYPISGNISRLISPASIYHNTTWTPKIFGIDHTAFTRDFPLSEVKEGVPTHFTVIKEEFDGTLTIRFNKYPDDLMKVEFEVIEEAKDLKNVAASIPKVPRAFRQILEYGTAGYILSDKDDDQAARYFTLAGLKLKNLMKKNRKQLMRTDRFFGQVIARRDQLTIFDRITGFLTGNPYN